AFAGGVACNLLTGSLPRRSVVGGGMESSGSASGQPPDMEAERRRRSGWLTSAAGAVLIVGVLYLGRDVLIPLAIAILLSFLLSPIVAFNGPIRVPRGPAGNPTAAMGFGLIGGFGVVVGTQATEGARGLPSYQTNIIEKLRTFREA